MHIDIGDCMIILFTSNNIASKNIADSLITNQGFTKSSEDTWQLGQTKLINTKAPTVLEVPTDFDTDCLMVLSTHKSKNPGRMLTAHLPGNWDNAEMGGSPRTLNIAPASVLKIMLQELDKEARKIGWETSLEADHHGPTCKLPILFVEIGSGEREWADKTAADAVARAITAVMKREERFETFFGVGGGHYPKAFTKLTLQGELAVGHILPKYLIDTLDEDMFRQAIERSVEKVTKVIIAKDETNMSQKEKIKAMAEKFSIRCEMI